MSNKIKILPVPITKKTPIEKKDKLRKPYYKPQLEELGDLRTLTLGGSPGGGDSGGSMGTRKPIGSFSQPGFLDPDGFPQP
jgi:hypothetical protein